MMVSAALMSSASCDWETPQAFFDALNRRFSFTLDPCCTAENAKCDKYYTCIDDGLSKSWVGERVFMNPPYGRDILPWVKKAREEAAHGALVVGLLPSRTDTLWWQDHVQGHADVRFIKGRLRFGGSKNSASFPSALAIWWGWDVLGGGFAGIV